MGFSAIGRHMAAYAFLEFFKIWFLWSKFALSHKNLGKFLIIVSIFWHFRGPKSIKIEHTCISNMYRMFRHKNIENEKFQECIPFVLCAMVHTYLLKMASGETIRWSYECLPLLGIFFCVKNAEACWQLVKLSKSFSDIFHNSFTYLT